jgi:hypothetical protein
VGLAQDIPVGITAVKNGFRVCVISHHGHSQRFAGTFPTLEEASAAFDRAKGDISDPPQQRLRRVRKVEATPGARNSIGFTSAAQHPELPTGVRSRSERRYEARISVGGKFKVLGTFDTVEEVPDSHKSERARDPDRRPLRAHRPSARCWRRSS